MAAGLKRRCSGLQPDPKALNQPPSDPSPSLHSCLRVPSVQSAACTASSGCTGELPDVTLVLWKERIKIQSYWIQLDQSFVED